MLEGLSLNIGRKKTHAFNIFKFIKKIIPLNFLGFLKKKKIKKIKIFSAAAICTNRTMMIWAQVENVKKDWVV